MAYSNIQISLVEFEWGLQNKASVFNPIWSTEFSKNAFKFSMENLSELGWKV